jgi:hypothetical protein
MDHHASMPNPWRFVPLLILIAMGLLVMGMVGLYFLLKVLLAFAIASVL